jgi:hypothetical protein
MPTRPGSQGSFAALADEIECTLVALPVLRSDDRPPITCFVAERSEALQTLKSTDRIGQNPLNGVIVARAKISSSFSPLGAKPFRPSDY